MTQDAAHQSETNSTAERIDLSNEWQFGAFGAGARRTISGPPHAVQDIINTDNPALIRWAVFVVTFVPTATTLIAKLPEIITAITNALSR